MEKFVKTTESNLNQLPIKERIKVIQEQAKKLTGKDYSWKMAKKTLAYISAGTTYVIGHIFKRLKT
jgi:hypothetical protein